MSQVFMYEHNRQINIRACYGKEVATWLEGRRMEGKVDMKRRKKVVELTLVKALKAA